MTRVGIMTFLHNGNCGSTLQACALQRAVRSLGLEAVHIDYAPDRAEQVRNLIASGNSPALILDSLRRRHGRGGDAREGFAAFYRDHMELTARCGNHAALRRAAAEFDILLCGSDQVWSPVWLNPAYFLDFAGDLPRVAYACSLGVKGAIPARKARRMAKLIRPFRAVSVREEEGAALLEGLLPGLRAGIMPDPVFLMTPEEWRALAGNPRPAGTLVTYFLGEKPGTLERAAEEAARRGLALRVLGMTTQARSLPDTLPAPDPLSFLREIAAADTVATDSFHGAALAALLGRRVMAEKRWDDADPASKNSRVDQLRRHLNLPSQGVWEPGKEQEERAARLREQGLGYLRRSLTGKAVSGSAGPALPAAAK